MYEINLWPFNIGKSFVAVKLNKIADPDMYRYSGYGIGFETCGSFLY